MSVSELLITLTRNGVQLWDDGDQLAVRAPNGVLSSGLRSKLVEHKTEILAYLQGLNNSSISSPLPTVHPSREQRHLPFPLTDIQQAYWLGRSGALELGDVGCHAYVEFEGRGIDLARLNVSWQRMIERHEALRIIFEADGQQRILDQVPRYTIEVEDLRGQTVDAANERLETVRRRMSHQVLPMDQWPLFEIRAHLLDDARIRLHFSVDLLIADSSSIAFLFNEWQRLYEDPDLVLPPLDLSFRDYVYAEMALRESEGYERSRDYWFNRVQTMPPAPELPPARNADALSRTEFLRRSGTLNAKEWRRLKSRAGEAGLTPSGIVLAAFAETLAAWSKSPDFTVNVVISNRFPLHPQVNDIIGVFSSLNLLEVNHSAEATFEKRAQAIRDQLWADLEHRQVNGVRVLRELARQRGTGIRAQMPVVFTSTIMETARGDWLGEMVYGISQTPQVWLDHQISEKEGALIFNWDSVDELFPEGLLDDMFESYGGLLHSLAVDEDLWHRDCISLLPAWQLENLERNIRTAPEETGLLHEPFAVNAIDRPDHPAVVSPEFQLTYEEVHGRSIRLGRTLRQMGALPNTLIAVVMEKGWEQVVAAIGVLQSGAAYLPIDANLPRERMWHLLERGEVTLAITQPWLDEALEWPEGVRRLCVRRDDPCDVMDSLEPVQQADDLAYVIFTSGSTGQPKGVMIDHRAALNTIKDINDRFDVGRDDRVLALSSLSFDLSVYDVFGTLAAGGTIVIPSAESAHDPAHWSEMAARERITVWNSVPALMDMLVEYAGGRRGFLAPSLRLVLLSGDWIPLSLPDQIKGLVDGVEVISLGGATEASIWSIIYPIEQSDPDWKSIPYGRAMINQTMQVLDDSLEPRPVWVEGQIFIGGTGLAKGYWRDDEKTNASFITHSRTGERLYRTGDMGRYLPDGNIEFLGRADFQVKIQGHRIELGEVEAVLCQHPSVRTAVAAAAGHSRGGKRLIAYVVPGSEGELRPDELIGFLRGKLPDYMVPSSLVKLSSLPLTPNGKVDRRALPSPDGILPKADYVAPRNDTERTIEELVARLFGVEQVSVFANFYDLGIDSLQGTRLLTLIRETFSIDLSMRTVFNAPTIAELAALIEEQVIAEIDTLSEEEALMQAESLR